MTKDPDSRRFSRRRFLEAAGTIVLSAMPAARGFAASKSTADDVIDVVILGAGLAGLTAARDLQRAGCDSFLVLEAMDRVGGRTLNHDLGNGHFTEAGGQWIGPGQTAIADLARELGIGTFPTYYEGKTIFMAGGGKVAVDLKGTFGTDLNIAKELDTLARAVPSGAPWTARNAAELDRMSLGDWLAQQDFSNEDRIGWSTSSFLTGGVMPAKMGLLHFLSMINSADSRYERLDSIKDSAQETRISRGSQILSIRMAEALHDKLRLSSPVRRIRGWDEPVVTIDSDTGPVRARQVILAMSPAMCQQIAFAPALPAPRRALQQHWPAHSPARKVAHVYDKPFWRQRGLNGHVMQAGGPIFWAYDNSPEDGDIGVINAFVSQSMVPDDKPSAAAMLSEIYAEALGEDALHYTQYHDHDWGQDPWILSCVSAIPPGFWTQHGKALHPCAGRLIWAGTETADIWAGYMDGAVRSGHKSALKALRKLHQSA